MHSTRSLPFLAALLALLPATPLFAEEEPFLASAEVTFDPPGDDGQQVVTVRMAPGVTRAYDKLRFECVYAQSAMWTNSAGVARMKTTVAPVRFTYERESIRLTTELDAYVSFRFPVGEDDLRRRFGNTSFRAGVPIKIPRILVSGIVRDRVLWTYALPTEPGLRPVTEAQRVDLRKATETPPRPATAPSAPADRPAKLGEIDLD